jgi:hypothetical protein
LLLAVLDNPLERSARPVLIRLPKIDERIGSAHTLCGFPRCVCSDMAAIEPSIRDRLHIVQELVLDFPKIAGVFF